MQGSITEADRILYIAKSVKVASAKELPLISTTENGPSSSTSKKERKKLKAEREIAEQLQFINEEDELFYKVTSLVSAFSSKELLCFSYCFSAYFESWMFPTFF